MKKILIASLLAGSAIAATPASAVTFATYSQTGSSNTLNVYNNRDDSDGIGGRIVSVASNAGTGPGQVGDNGLLIFALPEFEGTDLESLGVQFHLDASYNQAAILNSAGDLWQQGVTGDVFFTSRNAFSYNSVNYAAGTELFRGSFVNAAINSGGGDEGAVMRLTGTILNYTSTFIDFSQYRPTRNGFNIGLTSIVSPGVGGTPGIQGTPFVTSIADFRATANGSFSAVAVPEPATWALMVMGFGLVGASMRNRRRSAVAA